MEYFMSIGSYVQDSGYGMRGLVIGRNYVDLSHPSYLSERISWAWSVLYEDGVIRGADENDLEMIQR